MHVLNRAPCAAAPAHIQGHIPWCWARGKSEHRVRARKVPTARDNLLALHRDSAIEQLDLSADGLGIRSEPFEADSHSRAGGLVAINAGRRAQVIDDDIEVAIAIEIGQG